MKEYIKSCVDDFNKFIEYIKINSPNLTAKVGVFGKKDTYKINSVIKYKRDVDGPKYNQDQYPIIDLMFDMVLNAKLYYKGNSERNKPSLIETPYMKEFLAMDDLEKYVFLLETYWTKYEFQEKFDCYNMDMYYNFMIEISEAKSGDKIMKVENSITARMYSLGASFLHHLSFLGMGNLELIDGAKGTYEDKIKVFIPNELGINITKFLITKALPFWNWDSVVYLLKGKQKAFEKNNIKPFEVFKNIFPDITINKTIEKANKIDRNGVYTFKVSLSKDLWRKIRLAGNHTFSDLHMAIQEGFEFDNDHLYAYYFGGSRRKGKAIYCEDVEDYDNKVAEETKIVEFELFKGQSFIYLFDFGDQWEFKVELVSFEKNGNFPIKPVIIESKGEPPEQYYSGEW
jgi:hypothetical protein